MNVTFYLKPINIFSYTIFNYIVLREAKRTRLRYYSVWSRVNELKETTEFT